MRIAIFSDSYTPIANGVSVSIETLVEELRSRGHSVHIFTSAYPRFRDKDPNVYRFRSLMTPFANEYPLAFPPFYPMLRRFRRHRFDLMHTHTPYTVGFVGLRWAESHYLPLVSTYHTLYEKYAHYVPFFPEWFVRQKISQHTHYYYNRCAQVIAPSEAALQSLEDHAVKRPITVIPTGNPEPRKFSKEEARKIVGSKAGEKLLLYVRRIAKEKNMPLLFEAGQLIMQERDDVRFWLVGDGPFRGQCEQLARDLGIGDRVRFVGAIRRDEVDMYYIASDLFIFSSMTETQGLVIGEAMSLGVPAVAVRGGGASAGIREDENGFVVGNHKLEFANIVSKILCNASLLGRLSEGAKRSAKQWTTGDMCDKVVEVYEGALTTHAGNRKRVKKGLAGARSRAN